jgi:hypothetical protein
MRASYGGIDDALVIGSADREPATIREANNFSEITQELRAFAAAGGFGRPPAEASNFTIFCGLSRLIFTNYQEIKGIVG